MEHKQSYKQGWGGVELVTGGVELVTGGVDEVRIQKMTQFIEQSVVFWAVFHACTPGTTPWLAKTTWPTAENAWSVKLVVLVMSALLLSKKRSIVC